MVSSVVNVFDDTTKSVSAGSRSCVASTKSMPSTFDTNRNDHRAIAVVAERLVGHDGPEVGAADADVDHVPDALAGVALPVAAADAGGEASHLVEHGVYVGDHVLPVDDDRGAPRRAKRDVEHGPVLGDVDLVATEHGVDALAQAAFSGQLQEKPEGLVRDAVLRVVEKETGALGRQAFAAAGIDGKEPAEMKAPDLLVVGDERLPRRAGGERRLCRVHCFASSWSRNLPRNALVLSAGDRLMNRAGWPPPGAVPGGAIATATSSGPRH